MYYHDIKTYKYLFVSIIVIKYITSNFYYLIYYYYYNNTIFILPYIIIKLFLYI